MLGCQFRLSPEFPVCLQRQQRHDCCWVSYTVIPGIPYVTSAWRPPFGGSAKTRVCLGSESPHYWHQHFPAVSHVFSSFYVSLSLLMNYNIHTHTSGWNFIKPFILRLGRPRYVTWTNMWEGSPWRWTPYFKDHHYLDFFPYRLAFLLLQCV